MAKRRSDIASRFNKMRGLEFSEKQTFVRIGEIVDGLINNRGPTNPSSDTGPQPQLIDVTLPPPINVVSQASVRSAKIKWDAVNSSKLNYYVVRYTNLDTGTSYEENAYTNNIVIRDKVGDFKGTVQSAGRGGTRSSAVEFSFTIPRSAISLEGAKNGSTTISDTVSDVLFTPTGYEVFGWVSFVLNTFWDPAGPDSTLVNIYVGDALATATLLVTIEIAEEEHTITNLPNTGPFAATRPVHADPQRSGNFQTTLAGAFGLFPVGGNIKPNENNRFWAVVTNRTAENDVVGLAITLFSATGAVGSVVTIEAQTKSVEVQAADLEIISSYPTAYDFGIANAWTIGMWVKYLHPTDPTVEFSLQSSSADENLINTGSTLSGGVTIALGIGNPMPGPEPYLFYQYNPGFLINTWYQIFITWNGAGTLAYYVNGVLQVPTLTITRGVLVLVTEARTLSIGSGQDPFPVGGAPIPLANAKLLWTALWSTALSAVEITYLYTGVPAANWAGFDLQTSQGSYASSASLLHWWRYGADVTTLAKDYGLATAIDLPVTNLTAADLFTDVPS